MSTETHPQPDGLEAESYRMPQQAEHARSHEIPDPLEGVIEGETRHERYVNFVNNVIGHIWPNEQNSGDWGRDLWRLPRRDTGDIGASPNFVPTALDPLKLYGDSFEHMVQQLGSPEYVRVRMVSPELMREGTIPLPTGGTCVAAETFAMRTMSEVSAGVENGTAPKEMLTDLARTYVEMAPTMTHISGGLTVTGQEAAVHFWESDMWIDRLTQWGLPRDEARQRVLAAYERTHEAIARKARLINPDAQLIAVDFDELDIPAGIHEWFGTMDMEWDPSTRVFEVLYTYLGPGMTDRVQTALRRKLETDSLSTEQRDAVQKLLRANRSTRHKQIDHMDWAGQGIPMEVVTGMRDFTEDERVRYEEEYPFRAGFTAFRWTHTHSINGGMPQTALVGGIDLPYGTTIAHENREMGVAVSSLIEPEYWEQVDAAVNNPARLHRRNVPDHFLYLEEFLRDPNEKAKLGKRKGELAGKINGYQRKLDDLSSREQRATQRIANNTAARDTARQTRALLVRMGTDTHIPLQEDEHHLIEAVLLRIDSTLTSIGARRAEDENSLTPEDWADLDELGSLRQTITRWTGDATTAEFSQSDLYRLNGLIAEQQLAMEQSARNIDEARGELETLPGLRAEIENDPHYLETAQEMDEITMLLAKSAAPRSLYPLSENPYVMHSINFLFDPDFVEFLARAVAVDRRKKSDKGYRMQANERLCELMSAVYPKLRAYYEYIYGLRDDLDTVRSMRVSFPQWEEGNL